MKILLIIFSTLFTSSVKSQNETSILKLRLDTCTYVKMKPGEANGFHSNPIYIANGIIINPSEINIDPIIKYDVVKCPESFKRFKHIGSQGAIVIETKQIFETTTPDAIREKKKIGGEVIFAVNSLLLLDSALKISIKAIDEIEIRNVIDPAGNGLKPCINIWTIPKKYREKYFIQSPLDWNPN